MLDWGTVHPRWSGVRTDVVDVRGTAVRVLRHDGPSLDDGGLPQVLVHGLGGSATNWLEVLADLGRFGPTVAMDLPGFGETRPPRRGASRIRAQVAFVRAFCQALGYDRVALHGNSMGGMIATLVAARDPALVDRLVLVAPAHPSEPLDAFKDLNLEKARVGLFGTPFPGRDRLFERFWARATPEQMWREMTDIVFADPSRVNPALERVAVDAYRRGRELPWRRDAFLEAAQSLIATLLGRRFRRAIDDVAVPTLFVWGEGDQLVSRHAVERTRQRHPEWEFRIYPNCGHAPQIELPDDYQRDVGGWLERTGVRSNPRPAVPSAG